MATEAIKSTAITNLDAAPMSSASPGEGGLGLVRNVTGSATGTTGVTSGSTYQLVRVPSNAKIKKVRLKLDATVTTFTGDIGLYYSSSLQDGTVTAFGKVNSNTGGQLFGAAVAYAAIVTWTDQTNGVTAANMILPAWKAAGLSVDPGGFFDIVFTTTATNNGAPVICADVDYVM